MLSQKKNILFLLLLLLIENFFASASSPIDSINTTPNNSWLELAAMGSSMSRTPFWLHANSWGIVPGSGELISLRSGIHRTYSPTSRDSKKKSGWKFSFGVEAVANWSSQSKLLLPQAYGAIAYKNWELSFGRFKQYVGLADYTLGTGSFVWSGNAMPIPKLQLQVWEYTTIPLTKGFVQFKGSYSDGFFEKNRPTTTQLKLHNKSLYIRLGRPNGIVKLHGGFNHAVEWGGKTPYETIDGQMPTGLKNYWYVITGIKPKGRIKNGSMFDNGNRVGNHVASLDGAVELDFKKVNFFIYRQNLIEDGSLFYLNNIKDGLNGMRIKRKNCYESLLSIHTIVLELLYTKNQGGGVSQFASHIRGHDDYYNNSQVRDGWSYYGRSIGTPFITPAIDNNWPVYANFFTNNNRVWVSHVGLSGNFGKLQWASKLSYSSNQGTFGQVFHKKAYQFSGLFTAEKAAKWMGGITLKASVATDRGKLFRNSSGIMLSIRKDGLFAESTGR